MEINYRGQNSKSDPVVFRSPKGYRGFVSGQADCKPGGHDISAYKENTGSGVSGINFSVSGKPESKYAFFCRPVTSGYYQADLNSKQYSPSWRAPWHSGVWK